MMSASEGGGAWKSRPSKGGCVNLLYNSESKCGQGRRGSKIPENLRTSYLETPQGQEEAPALKVLRGALFSPPICCLNLPLDSCTCMRRLQSVKGAAASLQLRRRHFYTPQSTAAMID